MPFKLSGFSMAWADCWERNAVAVDTLRMKFLLLIFTLPRLDASDPMSSLEILITNGESSDDCASLS